MPSLPVSALPYIPSVFSPGDRLTFAGTSQTRDDRGRWTCERPECSHVFTDSDVRRLYTDTGSLALNGLPLIAPAPVKADEPLPGRPVSEGERPIESDRPYLLAGDLSGAFLPLVEQEPGPWGVAQAASSWEAGDARPGGREVTLSASGVMWVRRPFCGRPWTYALIPAELPTGDDVVALMSVAVMRAAFSEDAFAVGLV
ncbi:hypothetical protein [Streptomyces coeruleorubidus]|uniref:hypothetical protein n=1 Tax=Streptomyces coeruleorubidus TaxID=116188 RepID=UPI0033B2896B